jgi:hypothetical protein
MSLPRLLGGSRSRQSIPSDDAIAASSGGHACGSLHRPIRTNVRPGRARPGRPSGCSHAHQHRRLTGDCE